MLRVECNDNSGPAGSTPCTMTAGHLGPCVSSNNQSWYKLKPFTQPAPFKSNHPDIHDFFLGMAHDRVVKGEKAYGQRLKPFDGRDNLLDAWEEAWDLLQYLTKEIYQRSHKEET